MDHKLEYAKLSALYSIGCDYCRENRHNQKAAKFVKKLGEELEVLAAQCPGAFDIEIWGCDEDEDVSHYDIDEDLNRMFGDRVRCDSEGGGFYAYCNSKDKDEILNWLNENYKTLNPTTSVADEPQNPYFSNSYGAVEYCKENKIEVTLPEFILEDALTESIDKINEEIAKLEAKKAFLIDRG